MATQCSNIGQYKNTGTTTINKNTDKKNNVKVRKSGRHK